MLEGIPVLDIGAPALVAFVVLLVLTDRLVWHKRLDKLEAEMEKRIAEKDERNAALLEALNHRDEQIAELSRHLTAENSLMMALHRRAEEQEVSEP